MNGLMLWCVLAGVTLASEVGAGSCRAASADRLKPLVELYTSEGCDSCPPADRWLSAQFPPGRSDGPIALALHVDYWDRLGWKDRFASPRHTERQQQAMRAHRATFVYTPQVLVGGRDERGWSALSREAIAARSDAAPQARIAIEVDEPANPSEVRARVKVDYQARRAAVVTVAYADSGLVSEVRAGENRGVRLRHDHVVRAIESRPLPAGSAKEVEASFSFSRPREAGEEPKLVAFVQETDTGAVLQALELHLGDCPRGSSTSRRVRQAAR